MGVNHVLYQPVIEFETEDGTLHRYTSSIGTVPPRGSRGDICDLTAAGGLFTVMVQKNRDFRCVLNTLTINLKIINDIL